MILPLNADRLLTRVAAEARQQHEGPLSPRASAVWRDRTPREPIGPVPGNAAQVPEGPRRRRLEHLVETAVVGEPEHLHRALSDDAVGWSPAVSYGSRSEAEAVLRDHVAPLLVTEFIVNALWWSSPSLVAAWHLVAVHAEPFLVADDLLIDVSDVPIDLDGASICEVDGDRIRRIQTYYDEASLVEQVVLDGSNAGS